MGGNRVNDLRRLPVLPSQLRTDNGMGPFHLMIDRLADIMEQSSPTRLFLVQPQLRRHHTADKCRLDGMEEDVLGVAIAKLKTPQQANELRMDAVDPDIKDSLL